MLVAIAGFACHCCCSTSSREIIVIGAGWFPAESIQKMGYHQLGIQLSDEDIAAIAVWMQSLTGELDAAYVAAPPSVSGAAVANLH